MAAAVVCPGATAAAVDHVDPPRADEESEVQFGVAAATGVPEEYEEVKIYDLDSLVTPDEKVRDLYLEDGDVLLADISVAH